MLIFYIERGRCLHLAYRTVSGACLELAFAAEGEVHAGKPEHAAPARATGHTRILYQHGSSYR